jgi:hypothetical protein
MLQTLNCLLFAHLPRTHLGAIPYEIASGKRALQRQTAPRDASRDPVGAPRQAATILRQPVRETDFVVLREASLRWVRR